MGHHERFPATLEDCASEDAIYTLPGGFREDVHGVVFSCRGVLKNINRVVLGRPNGNYAIMIDGTYKLAYNG